MEKIKDERGSAATKAIIAIIIICLIAAIVVGTIFVLNKKGIINLGENKNEQENTASLDTGKNNDYLKYVDKKDDEYIFLDKNGNQVSIKDYYSTGRDIAYGVYPAERDNGVALVNLDGKTIVESGKYFSYTNVDYEAYNYASKYFTVSDDKFNRGIIDNTGKVIVPVQYSMILDQCAEDTDSNEKEAGIYFLAEQNDTATSTEKREYYSPNGKKFFEYSQPSSGGNIYEEKSILLENGVAVISFTSKETGKVSIYNITTGELIVEHDPIQIEESDGTTKLSVSSTIREAQSTLVDTIRTSRTEEKRDVYFFGDNKSVSNKLSSDASATKYVFSSSSKKYYIVNPNDSSSRNKYFVYDETGKSIHEFEGDVDILKSASSQKYYFLQKGSVYDEQFNVVASDVEKAAGAHYLKDHKIYTMDGKQIMENVDTLSTITNSYAFSTKHDGTTFDIAKDNNNNEYVLNENGSYKLPEKYENLGFIGYGNKYFWYSDGKDTHIIDFNSLKEVGKFKDTKTSSLSVDENCNIIKKSNEYSKYYNFKGDLIYEVKK